MAEGRGNGSEPPEQRVFPVSDGALMEGHLAEFELKAGKVPPQLPRTPLQRAQDLVYAALEVDGARRTQLARKALQISPDCCDAYLLLAESARSAMRALELTEKAVEAGKRAIGPEAFEADVGHFWALLDTRPYMRALLDLAQLLWELDRKREAIGHLQEMLRLNPNDNQGVRYLLSTWLIFVGNDATLQTLFGRYPGDDSAWWLYNRALHLFRKHGSRKQARVAISHALRTNPFVPLYLLGVRNPPEYLPERYSPGGDDEAVLYLEEALPCWSLTPGALGWLIQSLAAEFTDVMTEQASSPHVLSFASPAKSGKDADV